MNQTAQGLASLGRGPDSMLVHMAPGEVKSLQQLAMAHGGSLTINPETGLPEAGFLSSILPMVLGAGAMMIPGLQGIGAAGIGLGLGGLEALRTGSLKKGLMAGLGAYGGAGLGQALAGAGMQASVAPQLAQARAGIGEVASAVPATGLASDAVNSYTANILSKTQPYVDASNAASTAFQNAGPLSRLQTMGSGISNLTSEAGRGAFMNQIDGTKGLMQAGLAAAAPMLMDTTTKQPEIKTDKDMGQRYQFNAGTQTPTPTPDVPGYENQGRNFGREQRYFNPTYTPIDNEAARKLHGYAYGGPVEDMSNGNDMAAYMGQDKFAEGGGVDSYTYDPVTQMYVKKSGEGATMVSPTGGISGASAGGGGGPPSGPIAPTTPEEFAEQSARNQKFSNFLTDISAVLSPGSTIARGLLDTPFAGGIANFFDPLGAVNNNIAVDNLGTYAVGPSMQSMQDALNADMAAARGDGGGGAGPPGADPSSDSGRDAGNSGSAPGGGAAAGGLMALAQGGISNLGDYSDGGRLLRGPGDGISDSIPAMIGKKQPARLADGEFVVPARIVSELGNGSTEAGARKLYAMMDRVQRARKKTVGKGKVAANSRSAKYLPA